MEPAQDNGPLPAPAEPAGDRTTPAGIEKPQGVERAVLSAVLPGLGQFAQGRRLVGAAQLGAAMTYGTAAMATGHAHLLWMFIAWNAWSAFDAWRNE